MPSQEKVPWIINLPHGRMLRLKRAARLSVNKLEVINYINLFPQIENAAATLLNVFHDYLS